MYVEEAHDDVARDLPGDVLHVHPHAEVVARQVALDAAPDSRAIAVVLAQYLIVKRHSHEDNCNQKKQ